MNNIELVKKLLQELPSKLEIFGIYEHDPVSWSLYFDKSQEIYIDHIEHKQELVLSTDLVLQQKHQTRACYHQILSSNHTWRAHGFSFVAISDDERFLSLIAIVSVTDSQQFKAQIHEHIQCFDARLRDWKRWLEDYQPPEHSSLPKPDILGSEHFLRV